MTTPTDIRPATVQVLRDRCRAAEQCLPDAQYRARLTALHDEMLAAIAAASVPQPTTALRSFANAILDGWPDSSPDGFEIQDAAVAHGLLQLKSPKPTQPCGEHCWCAAYFAPDDWKEGVQCYEMSAILTGEAQSDRAEIERAIANLAAVPAPQPISLSLHNRIEQRLIWLKQGTDIDVDEFAADVRAMLAAALAPQQDGPSDALDAMLFRWYFSDGPKGDFLTTYIEGIREGWSIDQWRAAIDAAMRGDTGRKTK